MAKWTIRRKGEYYENTQSGPCKVLVQDGHQLPAPKLVTSAPHDRDQAEIVARAERQDKTIVHPVSPRPSLDEIRAKLRIRVG